MNTAVSMPRGRMSPEDRAYREGFTYGSKYPPMQLGSVIKLPESCGKSYIRGVRDGLKKRQNRWLRTITLTLWNHNDPNPHWELRCTRRWWAFWL